MDKLIQNKNVEVSSILVLDTINNNPLALVSFLNNNNDVIPSGYKGSVPIAS